MKYHPKYVYICFTSTLLLHTVTLLNLTHGYLNQGLSDHTHTYSPPSRVISLHYRNQWQSHLPSRLFPSPLPLSATYRDLPVAHLISGTPHLGGTVRGRVHVGRRGRCLLNQFQIKFHFRLNFGVKDAPRSAFLAQIELAHCDT